jgi:hypothetical protein
MPDVAGRVAVPPLAVDAAAAAVAPPRIPAGADVALARRAGSADVPVLLAMPRAGRLLVARALHALAGRDGPLLAGTRLDDVPGRATVYVDVDALDATAAVALEALLDDGGAWVIAGAEPDVAIPAALAARLPVTVAVPPLVARRDDLPALAAATLARLAGRAGTTPPAPTAAALARLAAHGWPGDVAELDAVVARAFLRAAERGADHVDVRDLGLDALPAPAPFPPVEAPTGPAAPDVEFLLAELAHELKNPMVTIKTFADHLPALLEDAELRTRFATLTDDAIARMDGLLDNVLAFARLRPPHPEPLALGDVLDRVLADVAPELAERAVHVRRDGATSARCAADPDHLAYALRNLFAGVVREVPAREELALQTTANGVVTLRFAASTEAADRLRRLTAPGEDASLADPTLLPLAFRLARTVLERNGGALAVVPDGPGATSVVIRLPAAGAA